MSTRSIRNWIVLPIATGLATAAASAGVMMLSGHSAQAHTSTGAMPAHVFAPYFEAYTNDDPETLAAESGNNYLTMAFIQTASKGSCTPLWNGSTAEPIGTSGYAGSIASIQATGGNVIPSFGGYSADHDGTDIADSCTDVGAIAAAYESVVTTYNVTRIDLAIEDNSISDTAGIERRNKAVAMAEAWATANHRNLQFSYTLPADVGLDPDDLAVLKDAVAEKARVDVVNIMTFDYYDGVKHEMAQDSETSAAALVKQLATIYPSKSAAQLWGMIGVTEMIGIDDYGHAETFTEADAASVLAWAKAKGISTLSFWALNRDNGTCPETAGADTCSGVTQNIWAFSHTFEPFTSGYAGN